MWFHARGGFVTGRMTVVRVVPIICPVGPVNVRLKSAERFGDGNVLPPCPCIHKSTSAVPGIISNP